MRNFFHFTILTLVFLFSCACDKEKNISEDPPLVGGFRLHSFFQDGMVLQQNMPFRIWGQSQPGIEISALVSWTDEIYTCTVPESGKWVLDIPVPAASAEARPQTITIKSGEREEILSDLLIGEVWLLGGQSNMTFWMSQVRDWQTEIAAADYPDAIRFYTVRPGESKEPLYEWPDLQDEGGIYYTWNKCTPETAASMSAVGYYFGRMLHEKLGVPVGLVNTAYGGATAQSFVPAEVLQGDAELKVNYFDKYKDDPNVLVRPSELYNHMVNPLTNLSVKGFVWYQGEGNWDNYSTYPHLMEKLIGAWRDRFGWGDRSLKPFYYVQIAPYALGMDSSDPDVFYIQEPYIGYAYMREAQSKTRDTVEGTDMAVTMDVGNPDDIHPVDKKPVGERLARLALNRSYGMEDIMCYGPRYAGHKVEDGVIKISFDYADGLRTSDGASPDFFYVASAEESDQHTFYKAEASIVGSEVWLTCPEVAGPEKDSEDVEIRYAFLICPDTNLENGERLPAEPFRTDSWVSGIKYDY